MTNLTLTINKRIKPKKAMMIFLILRFKSTILPERNTPKLRGNCEGSITFVKVL